MRILVLVVLLSTLASCKPKSTEGEVLEQTLEGIMGTRVQIKVWITGESSQREAARAGMADAFEAAREVERRMSPYDPRSAVSRINEAAGVEAVQVDEWTWQVMAESMRASRETAGAFDPTWAALSGVWDFRAAHPRPPGPDAVGVKLPLVDWKSVQMDEQRHSVKLDRAGMRVGLGGSAKGFALDVMAQALRDRGLSSFICYAGGDLLVAGRHGTRPWKLGIQHPRDPGALVATYEVIRDMAVVTSGDYERYFLHEGSRYHHILDPRTGFPAQGAISVTLFASTGLRADALSTGIFVMGAEPGLKLVESLDGVEAVIIDPGGAVLVSSGMRDAVTVVGSVTP